MTGQATGADGDAANHDVPLRRSAAVLAACLAASTAAAAAGSIPTVRAIPTWYRMLDTPPWTPPDAAFGPAWSVLYAGQAVAAWLAWRADPGAARPVWALHGAQLVLNAGWSLVFFGLRRPGLALVEIAVLWVAIAVTARAMFRRSRAAGALFLPYLAWVMFAAALNWSIWRRNG